MATIEEDGDGFKVSWRRRLPEGGYRKRSAWMKSRRRAAKLAALVEANNGMTPAPTVLASEGLTEFGEPVDPLFVVRLAETLDREMSDSEKIAELREFLAHFEEMFDNADGSYGTEVTP